MMKKMVIVALLASGLVACAQDPAPKRRLPSEGGVQRLHQYSTRIARED